MSKADQVFELRNRAFRVLYDTVLDSVNTDETQTFALLCKNLCKIARAEMAILAIIDPRTRDQVARFIYNDEEIVRCDCDISNTKPLPEELLKKFSISQLIANSDYSQDLLRYLPEFFKEAAVGDGKCYAVSCLQKGDLVAVGMFRMYKDVS